MQLALNAAWTPVFFAGQLLAAGLAVIVALDLTSPPPSSPSGGTTG